MADKRIVAAIRASGDREMIENTFRRFGIAGWKERTRILLEAMYYPLMFFSGGEPTDEERYEMTMDTFMAGRWRRAEALYNAGLVKEV